MLVLRFAKHIPLSPQYHPASSVAGSNPSKPSSARPPEVPVQVSVLRHGLGWANPYCQLRQRHRPAGCDQGEDAREPRRPVPRPPTGHHPPAGIQVNKPMKPRLFTVDYHLRCGAGCSLPPMGRLLCTSAAGAAAAAATSRGQPSHHVCTAAAVTANAVSAIWMSWRRHCQVAGLAGKRFSCTVKQAFPCPCRSCCTTIPSFWGVLPHCICWSRAQPVAGSHSLPRIGCA